MVQDFCQLQVLYDFCIVHCRPHDDAREHDELSNESTTPCKVCQPSASQQTISGSKTELFKTTIWQPILQWSSLIQTAGEGWTPSPIYWFREENSQYIEYSREWPKTRWSLCRSYDKKREGMVDQDSATSTNKQWTWTRWLLLSSEYRYIIAMNLIPSVWKQNGCKQRASGGKLFFIHLQFFFLLFVCLFVF